MSFTYINKDTENKLRQIQNLISLYKNGPVSQSMKEAGLNYKVNFGVSVVDLRKIAKPFTYDITLAKLLWEKDWRETYILATLIADPNNLKDETLMAWFSILPTTEIAEQTGNNLLAFRKDSTIMNVLLNSEINLSKISAFKALAKQFMLKNLANKTMFLKSLEDFTKVENKHKKELAMAIGQASAYYYRTNKDEYNPLFQLLEKLITLSVDFKISKEILITEQYLHAD